MQDELVREQLKIFRRTLIFTLIMLVISSLALGSATYAWFTSNGEVSTSRVAATTSESSVRLLISQTGGTAFVGSDTAAILQLNASDVTKLLPVSTSDLENFVYKVGDEENSRYLLDAAAKKYYHGRVYVKAESDGATSYSHLALYLNDIDEMISPELSSLVANAARLGLKLEGASPVILAMSTRENGAAQRISNTWLNGTKVPDGRVIRYGANGQLTAVEDPAVTLDSVAVTNVRPNRIATIAVDRVYALDIYFYLEGCDPDCSDSIRFNAADVFVSLFGVPEE